MMTYLLRIILFFCILNIISSIAIGQEKYAIPSGKKSDYTIHLFYSNHRVQRLIKLETRVTFLGKEGDLSLKVTDFKVHNTFGSRRGIITLQNLDKAYLDENIKALIKHLPNLTFYFDKHFTLTQIDGLEENTEAYSLVKEELEKTTDFIFPKGIAYPSHPYLYNTNLGKGDSIKTEKYVGTLKVEKKSKKQTVLNYHSNVDFGEEGYSENLLRIQLDKKNRIEEYRGFTQMSQYKNYWTFEIFKHQKDTTIKSTFVKDFMKLNAESIIQSDYDWEKRGGFYKNFLQSLPALGSKEFSIAEKYIDNILKNTYYDLFSNYYSFGQMSLKKSTLRAPFVTTFYNVMTQDSIPLNSIDVEEKQMYDYRLSYHVADSLFDPSIKNDKKITFDVTIHYPYSLRMEEYDREDDQSVIQFSDYNVIYKVNPKINIESIPYKWQFIDKYGREVYPWFHRQYTGVDSYLDLTKSFVMKEKGIRTSEIVFQYLNIQKVRIYYFDKYHTIKRKNVKVGVR